MKVIELLNKIANGEEVPKKIKFNGFIWNYDIYNKRYCDGEHLLFNVLGHYKGIILNDEVEVIEEDKKIEKLNKKHFHKKQRQLANKINEIIDKINEGE